MLTIIDILIYVFFAFFSSSLARKSENYIESNGMSPLKWDRYLVWFVVFFTVIGGIRWNVGVDSLSYAYIFTHGYDDVNEREILWRRISNFIYNNGIHWTIGLAFCAFIQIYFIVKSIQPYRWLLVFIPFVMFGGRYWLDCMNAVRQMMVACAFLWASRFILEKKILPYAVFVAVASMIHGSAMMLLPFFLLPDKIKIYKRKWILLGILLACVLIGQTPAYQQFAGYVQDATASFNYDRYSNTITDRLMAGKSSEALNFGPMMHSYLLIPAFIIWFGEELHERFGRIMPLFNLWFNLAYFYACAYFLVCNISHLFIRPLMYFSLFQMMMAAMLLYYLYEQKIRYGLRRTVFAAFCVIMLTNTTWDVIKSSGQPFDITTYKIFIFHISPQKPLGI